MSNFWFNKSSKKKENSTATNVSTSTDIQDKYVMRSSSMVTMSQQYQSSSSSTFVQTHRSESTPSVQERDISNRRSIFDDARPRHVFNNDGCMEDALSFRGVPPRSAFFSQPLTSTSSQPAAKTCALQFSGVNGANDSEELKGQLSINVKKSTQFYDDPKQTKVPTYLTRSKNRGKLLLINNIKFINENQVRKGAKLDEANVVQLFTEMGFEINRFRNLTKREMESKIISFRSNTSLKKVDICTVIIMSHGTGKERSDSTEVVCTDEKLLETTWIINQFDASSCPHLHGKPKIFIFQCCRGDNKDVEYDSVPISTPRKLSDMLIAYSTIPGFVSHRHPENGTWYIQAICKTFMENAYDTDIESLLKMVDNALASLVSHKGTKQTSSFENRGFKTCYLHPKLYES